MFDNFRFFFHIVSVYWWTFTPIVLFFILQKTWIYYIQTRYVSSLDWMLLEVKLPKEVEKTPKTFEIALSGIHALAKSYDVWERNVKGLVPQWLSLEIVGKEGETHFFIRTLKKSRNLVEAKLHGAYPDAEVSEVEDYMNAFPADIPNKDYDIGGGEMILSKPDGYPIRTYEFFEDPVDERRQDPLASLVEVFSRLGPREQICLQFVVRPVSDSSWKEEGQHIVADLMGRPRAKKSSPFSFLGDLLGLKEVGDAAGLIFTNKEPSSVPSRPQSPTETMTYFKLSSGEREVVEAVEKNIAKLAYQTTIRFIYVASHDVFDTLNIASMFGYFKQFNTLNLNGFARESTTFPNVQYLFPKQRNYARKRSVFTKYKSRKMRLKPFFLNTEELASVYHFPGMVVAAPLMPRIQAKKGEPPATLPVE